MKKNFIGIFIFILCVAIAVVFTLFLKEETKVSMTNGEYYSLTTKIVSIDRKTDFIICKDCNGNLWTFYGSEDWEINDCASLLMNTQGTKEIFDDTIEAAKYCSWEINN